MAGRIVTYTDTGDWMDVVAKLEAPPITLSHASLTNGGLDISDVLTWVNEQSGANVHFFETDDPALGDHTFCFDNATDFAFFKLRWHDHIEP